MAGQQLEDPYSFFARARSDEPVFFSSQFQMWFVTRYDDVRSVLSDPSTFSSEGAIPDYKELGPEVRAALEGYRQPRSLVNMDPPNHTRLRRLVRESFAPRRVAAMRDAVRSVATGVVNEFAADGEADLVSQFAYPVPLAVVLQLLGVPAEDLDACRRWTADLKQLNFSMSRLAPSRQVECARGVLAFQRYLENLVAGWAPGQGGRLVDCLVQARGDEDGGTRLSVEEVADQVLSLIVGGHETLASALGSTMYLLLVEPGRWHQVGQQSEAREAAIEEGLRLEPPFTGTIRTTTRPVRLGGVALPSQARLFLLFGSANRDEHRFAEAGQCRLDRDRKPTHLAFGHGIHYCVGAPLARLEMSVAIEVLAERLPGLRLAPGAIVEHVPGLMFRSLARLPVIWDPRP